MLDLGSSDQDWRRRRRQRFLGLSAEEELIREGGDGWLQRLLAEEENAEQGEREEDAERPGPGIALTELPGGADSH